jgi:hypothetical protein
MIYPLIMAKIDNHCHNPLWKGTRPNHLVGAIHEAAVLFWGNPRIKNRQDIAPTRCFEMKLN